MSFTIDDVIILFNVVGFMLWIFISKKNRRKILKTNKLDTRVPLKWRLSLFLLDVGIFSVEKIYNGYLNFTLQGNQVIVDKPSLKQ